MKRSSVLLMVIVLFTLIGYSQIIPISVPQQSQIDVKPYKKFYFGLGGTHSSFQDVKYSNVHYNGIGTRLDFGFEKYKNTLWGIDLVLMYSKEKAKTHSAIGSAAVINGVLSVQYLYPVMKNKIQKLYFGGKWAVLEFYYRKIEGLENNGAAFIFSSNMKFSSVYERKLSKSLRIQAGIDFQIFGFIQQSTSFGFSAPQDVLESGGFSYQNKALEEPSIKYMNFEPFWSYFDVGTTVKLHYKKRWSLAYKWNIQRSNEVKNYPMIKGYNSMSIIYNITNN